jgi:DNA-directed RNA polymerase
LAKVNKPLRYTSALGFPIISQYHDPIIERISVYLNGRRRRVNLAVGDETDIRRHKAANAAPANFVHSVDAAHLQLTSLATAKEGIDL